MSKLKEQFSELRQNTPKRVQWLLLVVAFIMVIILLTLLLSGGKKQEDISKTDQAPTVLKIEPNIINWADVVVGDKKTQTIKVSATAPVKIIDVRWHKDDVTGLDVGSTCVSMDKIAEIGCRIEVTFTPTKSMDVENVPVFIDWHDADETVAMKRTDKVVLTLGAVLPQEDPKPTQAPTDATPDVVTPTEPITPKQEIQQEIEAIAPPVVFDAPDVVETKTDTVSYVIPDGCSDFAFPGYGNSGRQIGWIKPSGGVYKFHPFSDQDCTKPTGTYNPINGIITDDDGKKIGTDADHIGFSVISSGEIPELSNAPAVKKVNRAQQLEDVSGVESGGAMRLGDKNGGFASVIRPAPVKDVVYGTTGQDTVTSTAPYDRTFVLRQYKPIPATIVSDVRADIDALNLGVPVRATVDRNVYSDNGRTIVIPTGTLLLGYVTGEVPGPYKAIGRMNIKWYQFIRPDGVEFNFPADHDPYSGDAQGRVGVPGRGSTDYLEQFFMPMLTAFVPAAVNLINPVADAFVNQIDLDNNTVVQSGTMRSSELAKNEIITAWNQVAQKLLVDMMDNTVPPFTIAAGTRITVYSPVDLQITCGDPDAADGTGKKCAVAPFGNNTRRNITKADMDLTPAQDDSWIGQSRSFAVGNYCEVDSETGLYRVKPECSGKNDGNLNQCGGHSYSTLKLYCDSLNYQSKKALQYEEYRKDQAAQYQEKITQLGGKGSQKFNEEILGVQYNEDGTVKNPYASDAPKEEPAQILCEGNVAPDANGCCPGEIYTDLGDQGFNCCPEGGGDCFPPII